VSRNKPVRRRHVPQRTCVGCHQVLDKRSLIRLVRTSEGIKIDPSGKSAGRGAYLHDRRECWDAGLAGALARALKTSLNAEDRQALKQYALNLPEESPGS